MKTYLPTVLFYGASAIIIYVANALSPNQQDGGPGFGSLLIVLLVLTSLILAIINLVKGFKNSQKFILAVIHFLVLLIIVSTLFI